MSIAKVIELSSSSPKGIEDAVQQGLRKVSQTVKNISGAWVNDIKVITGPDGSITEWRVNMRINFIVDWAGPGERASTLSRLPPIRQ
jgi:flavin-binding protein dodecin